MSVLIRHRAAVVLTLLLVTATFGLGAVAKADAVTAPCGPAASRCAPPALLPGADAGLRHP